MQSIIIPALDLIDGHVVRLHQGDYAQQTTYSDNPIEQFASYIQQGAQQLHLVDLTGAKDPSKRQTALIGKIIAATQSKIQVGGGIRTEQDVADLLAVGANRVVIGSTAVTQPDMVQGWFNKYGAEKFVLALDVRIENEQKLVAIKGWQETSALTLENIVENYRALLACNMCFVPTFPATAHWRVPTCSFTVKCALSFRMCSSSLPAASVRWRISKLSKALAWRA